VPKRQESNALHEEPNIRTVADLPANRRDGMHVTGADPLFLAACYEPIPIGPEGVLESPDA
jgi:hypothetical protein